MRSPPSATVRTTQQMSRQTGVALLSRGMFWVSGIRPITSAAPVDNALSFFLVRKSACSHRLFYSPRSTNLVGSLRPRQRRTTENT
jgi:hypothetical protein